MRYLFHKGNEIHDVLEDVDDEMLGLYVKRYLNQSGYVRITREPPPQSDGKLSAHRVIDMAHTTKEQTGRKRTNPPGGR